MKLTLENLAQCFSEYDFEPQIIDKNAIIPTDQILMPFTVDPEGTPLTLSLFLKNITSELEEPSDEQFDLMVFFCALPKKVIPEIAPELLKLLNFINTTLPAPIFTYSPNDFAVILNSSIIGYNGQIEEERLIFQFSLILEHIKTFTPVIYDLIENKLTVDQILAQSTEGI